MEVDAKTIPLNFACGVRLGFKFGLVIGTVIGLSTGLILHVFIL